VYRDLLGWMMSGRISIVQGWFLHESRQSDVPRKSCTFDFVHGSKNRAVDPNVTSCTGSSKAVQTCLLKRRPITAPINSSRGMLIVFNGANRVFAATSRTDTQKFRISICLMTFMLFLRQRGILMRDNLINSSNHCF
jgi:hypothetical protein